MRPIAEVTSRIAGKSFGRKYIAIGKVVSAWSEIIGPDLATKAQPVKLNYAKRDGTKTPSAILEIAANPSDATMLHYQKDLILERINRIFGAGWITGIRFVAMESNSNTLRRPKIKKTLTDNEKSLLTDMLCAVDDAPLRETLHGLGEEIFRS
jgi:hypothetical protein